MYFGKIFLAILTGLLLATTAQADDSAELIYRQKLMQLIGANNGAINHIVKNDLPHRDQIATYARAIEAAGGLIEAAFKKQIVEGRTDSKPEVWQQWDEYVAAAAKMSQAGAALAAAAESGDGAALRSSMRSLGSTCGGCHKIFRKPKAERFKRN